MIFILPALSRGQTWEGAREGVYAWMPEEAVYQSGWGILSFRGSTNMPFKADTFSEMCRKEDEPDTPRWVFEWLIVTDWQMQGRVSSASSGQYILTENIFGLKTAVNHMEKLDSIRNWAFLERIHFRNPWWIHSCFLNYWRCSKPQDPTKGIFSLFSADFNMSYREVEEVLALVPQQDIMAAGRM